MALHYVDLWPIIRVHKPCHQLNLCPTNVVTIQSHWIVFRMLPSNPEQHVLHQSLCNLCPYLWPNFVQLSSTVLCLCHLPSPTPILTELFTPSDFSAILLFWTDNQPRPPRCWEWSTHFPKYHNNGTYIPHWGTTTPSLLVLCAVVPSFASGGSTHLC